MNFYENMFVLARSRILTFLSVRARFLLVVVVAVCTKVSLWTLPSQLTGTRKNINQRIIIVTTCQSGGEDQHS